MATDHPDNASQSSMYAQWVTVCTISYTSIHGFNIIGKSFSPRSDMSFFVFVTHYAAILKEKLTDNYAYASIPNSTLRDSQLPLDTIDLIAYFLSLPEDWHDLRAKHATDVDAAGGDATANLLHDDKRTADGYLRAKKAVTIKAWNRKEREG